jgi:hypothetical protein
MLVEQGVCIIAPPYTEVAVEGLVQQETKAGTGGKVYKVPVEMGLPLP